MKRVALILVLLTGVFAGSLFLTFNPSQVVYAQCGTETKNGKSVATTDGTLVCDCTVTGTNCRCTVSKPCPPGGGGYFEIEEGGSY